jgi:excisionase family DNA binding protein
MTGKTFRIEEAAKLLNVSVRSVFRYIHEKKLQATKIGFWRISEDDLQKFIAGRSNISPRKKK